MSIFISYARTDNAIVQPLIADLTANGVEVWIDHQGLKAGTPDWEQALRDAIREASAVLLAASPASRKSLYVRDELAIARMYNKPVYPIWVDGDEWIDSIAIGMGATQFIDARKEKYAAAIPLIIAALNENAAAPPTVSEESPSPVTPETRAITPINPFKGLNAFTERDADYFFGREAFVAELIDKLDSRFLAIVGPSGSGKSSIVMAGLIPRLKAGAIPHSETWTYLDRVLPGAHPLESLSNVLADALGISARSVREDLDNPNRRGLHQLAQRIVKERGRRLVLYVDQFEEIFTQTVDERERQQFIDLLTTAATEPDGYALIILTLRADFYDRPLNYPDLVELLKAHHPIPPMGLADLLDAVQKPADVAGLTFEDGLVSELVFDVRDQIGALPLMQFALDELYRLREGDVLTRAAYDSIGGVKGALAKQAEDTYTKLPSDEHRRLARALFLRLIEPGATEQETARRRANLNELILSDVPASDGGDSVSLTDTMRAVADAFVTARLLTTDEQTIEVSHEALIREWERLREWLHNAREDVLLGKTLAAAAAEWERREKPDDRLYRGSQLSEAQSWLARNIPSRLESEFVTSSAAHETHLKAVEVRRNRNLRELKILLVIALSLVFVIFLLFGAANVQQQAQALVDVQEQVATSDANLHQAWDTQALFLADLSRQQLEQGYVHNALNLALESLAHYDDGIFHLESSRALVNALDAPAYEMAFFQHENGVNGGDWNQDESRILTWSHDGSVRVWNSITSENMLTLRHLAEVWGAAWNGDESRILSWSDDSTIRVWDATTGAELLTLRHDNKGEDPVSLAEDHYIGIASVGGAAWNGDESRILSWSDDGTVRVWDATTGAELLLLRHEDYAKGAAWNGDESRILSWSYDGTVRVWDATTGAELLLLRYDNAVYGAVWSKDDSRILSWSADGTARVWDIATGMQLLLLHHDNWVDGAVWNRDESRILSWSYDGKISVWDASNGNELLSLHHEDSVFFAMWNKNESRILSWSHDGTTRIWDAAIGEILLTLRYEDSIWGAAWNRDESRILSWSRDGTARVWDLLTMHHEGSVSGATWNSDESRILSWSSDNTVRVWDTTTGTELLTMHHEGGVSGATWNSDESRILSWSSDNTVRVWDTTTGVELLTLHHKGRVYTAAWNEDESRILSWSELSNRGVTSVWDAITGVALLTIYPNNDVDINLRFEYSGPMWNKVGSRILAWSDDGNTHMWDTENGDELLTLSDSGLIWGAAWNRDESRILAWSLDGTFGLWDIATGENLPTLSQEDYIWGAAWNRDENRILAWSFDYAIRVWDAAKGNQLLTIPNTGLFAAWNSDESRILSWGGGITVQVWDAITGENLLTLRHEDFVSGAAWNSDGSRILSWSTGINANTKGASHVWDVATGAELLTLPHDHESWVNGATWNGDESRILSWSSDGTIRIWPGNIEGFIELGESRILRPLSNAEREQFFLPIYTPSPTLDLTQFIATPSITPLPTLTPSPTGSPSITPLPTLTPSTTPSNTPTATPT